MKCPFCNHKIEQDFFWDAHRSMLICSHCKKPVASYLDMRPLDEQKKNLQNFKTT